MGSSRRDHGTRDVPRRIVHLWRGPDDLFPGKRSLHTDIEGSTQPPTMAEGDVLTLYLGEDKPLVELRFWAPGTDPDADQGDETDG